MINLRVILFLTLPLLGAILHILIKQERSKERIIELFLLYWLAIAIGVSGISGFYGHFFLSDRVAEAIGWPAGNPFQLEIAFTNLAIGSLGVFSTWYRREFWLATAIATTVFLFGANVVHIMDIVERANYAPGNSGLQLLSNFAKPVVLIGLMTAHSRVTGQEFFIGKNIMKRPIWIVIGLCVLAAVVIFFIASS